MDRRGRSQKSCYQAEYSATWRHTSVAGNMMVFCREHGSDHEIKVAPRVTLVLDRIKILSKTSFFMSCQILKPYPEIFDFAEGLMQRFPKSLIWESDCAIQRATWQSHSYGFAFAVRFVSESLAFFGQKGNSNARIAQSGRLQGDRLQCNSTAK